MQLVTAIITTYARTFDLVERSIKSVLNQTYSNIELILVDDNNNGSVIRNSIEKGIGQYLTIRYIKHEINQGVQKSRNDGITAANGVAIAFLDDDDEWFPTKIEKQLELMVKGVGLVYSKGYRLIETDQGKIIVSNYDDSFFKPEFTFQELLFRDSIGTTSQALVLKEALVYCKMFDENQPARQDYQMWLRISRKYRCVGVDKYLFNYYVHNGEQITKNDHKSMIGYENIYKEFEKDYRNDPYASARIFKILKNLYKKHNNTAYLKYTLLFYSNLIKALLANPVKFLSFCKQHLVNRYLIP